VSPRAASTLHTATCYLQAALLWPVLVCLSHCMLLLRDSKRRPSRAMSTDRLTQHGSSPGGDPFSVPPSALHPGNYPTLDPAHAHPRPWTCLISRRHLFHPRIGPACAEDGILLSCSHSSTRQAAPRRSRPLRKKRKKKKKTKKKRGFGLGRAVWYICVFSLHGEFATTY
jgi:hypothetical protein